MGKVNGKKLLLSELNYEAQYGGGPNRIHKNRPNNFAAYGGFFGYCQGTIFDFFFWLQVK